MEVLTKHQSGISATFIRAEIENQSQPPRREQSSYSLINNEKIEGSRKYL
jgi:hypothetical protein